MRIRSQNIQFFEKSNENPIAESSDLVVLKDYFDTKHNAPEAKTTNDAQVVSTDIDEKLYIKTVAVDNELKNHKFDQTLKQKQLKKEVNAPFQNKGNKLQYKFNLEQLPKLEGAKPLLKKGSVCRLTKKTDELAKCKKSNKLSRLADRSAGGWMN